MASYTVHVPSVGPDPLQRARFVRDGFSAAAFAFGPLWLLAKGAWISALLMLALHGILAGLFAYSGVDPRFAMAAVSLVNLAIALEGSSLIRWELLLKGWQEAGLVAGDDIEQLEARFFESKLADRQPPLAQQQVTSPRGSTPAGVIGLFPVSSQGHPRAGQ